MSPSLPQQMRMGMGPELEFVLCCAHTRIAEGQAHRIRVLLCSGLNWSEVVGTALQHKLAPIVYERVMAAGGDLLPPAQLQVLRESAWTAARSSLTLLRELLSIYELFEAEQIPVIPYKGPVLAWLAFGNLTRRTYVDLDFAIPQRYIPQATTLLQAVGYSAGFDLREAHAGKDGFAPGQYSFFSNAELIPVELHTERTLRYFPTAVDFDEMSRRLITVEIAGRKLRTFSIEDTLIMLCVHGAKHFWERLAWILDVAELVAVQPVDWPLALRIAAKLKSTRLLLLGLYLAHDLLGAPLPQSVLEQAQKDSNVRWLAARVGERLFAQDRSTPGAAERVLFRLRMCGGLWDGVRYCWRLATIPTEADWSRVHLPRQLSTLYRVLRPLRLLQQYGLGSPPKKEGNLAAIEPTPPAVDDSASKLPGFDLSDKDTAGMADAEPLSTERHERIARKGRR